MPWFPTLYHRRQVSWLGMAVPGEVQTMSALHHWCGGAQGNLLCCERLSGAGGVRGQLEAV